MREARSVTIATLLSTAAAASAVTSNPQCVREAQTNRKACKNDCQDQFITDVALCRNVSPQCLQACRQQRTDCLAPLIASLETCTDGCNDTLKADKAACPPVGDPTRGACVDAAQVTAFICRDTCRDQWRTDPNIQTGVRFCRNQLKHCVSVCPAA